MSIRRKITAVLRIFIISAVIMFAVFICITSLCGVNTVLAAAVTAPAIICLFCLLSKKTAGYITDPINDINRENINDSYTYSEIKSLYERMSAENKEFDQMEIMRREFTANASHELKTPLTTISGYAQMMAVGMARPENMKEFSTKIAKESKRMLKLIDDIINLSNLDDGGKIENPEKIDLSLITQEAILTLEKSAKERGIQIYFSHGPVHIMGDPTLVGELVYNLIDNAIKYNKDGGKIIVFTGETAKGIEFSVKDTGIGIPEKDIDRIFERFYRVDKSHSKQVGGTGLGLSIVKHVCLLHNADVRVKSDLGNGSTFYVYFPPCEQ